MSEWTAAQIRESVALFRASRNTENPRLWDQLSWRAVEPMIDSALAHVELLEVEEE